MIPRALDDLNNYLKKGKVLVVFGPRQVGKTTLLKNFLSKTQLKYRFDNGEDFRITELFSSGNPDKLSEYAKGYELVVIDEAQKIPDAGSGLKMLIDNNPELMVIATGSSSFELAGTVGEPLTGRKRTLTMFPVAQIELSETLNRYDLKEKLEEFLVYGSYPEVITAESKEEKSRIITELTHSYLLKDIIAFDRIKNSRVIFDLLRMLAFQTGSEVSLSEIGKNIGVDAKTVNRYIDILEKSFVIFRLTGFSRNLRKEIVKKNKYYFYDTGIRNALISNFNPLSIRNDIGQLWENLMFIERLKRNSYKNVLLNSYFWRTWNQQEIDLVEEREGKLFGYEFKYGGKIPQAPALWIENYSEASFEVVNRANYLDFIL
ncbi:MAG TPA: ATP-binding protein [bacterium]|nr:ATP-binding protein [bacterium]HPS30234.1 ATP-binding protein [bacterium]